MFCDLGLCISYDRVLSISTDIANLVTSRFEQEGVVCPPKLYKDVFTTGAIDKIDHNPSATTAHDSFHGTTISLFQHPTAENRGSKCNIPVLHGTVQTHKHESQLPESFCNVPPAILPVKNPIVPDLQSNIPIISNTAEELVSEIQNEREWLENAKNTASKEKLDKDDLISWAAFHAAEQPNVSFEPAVILLLPMFVKKRILYQ